MMRLRLSVSLLLVLICTFCAAAYTDRLAESRHWCDTATLTPLEGIWLLPQDRVYVLARRQAGGERAVCSLSVVVAFDGLCEPGMRLGTLAATADWRKVTLTLPTRKGKHRPEGMRNCTLTVADDGWSLLMEPLKSNFSFSISPVSLLPGFWKMIRLKISPGQNRKVQGMVKVYPGYDGNGSNRHIPRYI